MKLTKDLSWSNLVLGCCRDVAVDILEDEDDADTVEDCPEVAGFEDTAGREAKANKLDEDRAGFGSGGGAEPEEVDLWQSLECSLKHFTL